MKNVKTMKKNNMKQKKKMKTMYNKKMGEKEELRIRIRR